MHQSDPSVDRSIKTVRQLEEVFEPYGKTFPGSEGKNRKQLPSQCFCQGKKNTKNNKHFFGRPSTIHEFSLFGEGEGSWNLTPAKSER
jgi:hypothetical protein